MLVSEIRRNYLLPLKELPSYLVMYGLHMHPIPSLQKVKNIVWVCHPKYHRLGGLNNINLFYHSSRDWESKIKAPGELESDEASLLGLQTTTFSLYLHMAFPLYMNRGEGGTAISSCSYMCCSHQIKVPPWLDLTLITSLKALSTNTVAWILEVIWILERHNSVHNNTCIKLLDHVVNFLKNC